MSSLFSGAATLAERIALVRASPDRFVASDDAEELLRAWREHTERHSGAGAFERRLRFDELTLDDARRLLGRVELPPASSRPAWLTFVDQVLVEAGGRGSAGQSALAPPEPSHIAFPEHWGHWVRVARRRLAERAGPAYGELAPAVRAALDQVLWVELARCGTRCLMHELAAFRASYGSSSQRFARASLLLPVGDAGAQSTEIYDAFVERIAGAGAAGLLERYPCMARLAAMRALLWVSRTSELCQRLAADHTALARRFTDSGELGELVALEPDMSDPHDGGRCVVGLRYASGVSLVYKPRPLAGLTLFQALAAWTARRGGGPDLGSLAALERDGYGYVERVAPAPCADADELGDYYARCGALLALMRFLRGRDCHAENLVACGATPVLVDYETMLAPAEAPPAAAASPLERIEERLESSVLRVGLLPEWRSRADGAPVDIGGLAGSSGSLAQKAFELLDPGTDAMRVAATTRAPPACSHNVPWVAAGPPHSPPLAEQPAPAGAQLDAAHVAALVGGFGITYHALAGASAAAAAGAEALTALSEAAPLTHIATRVVVRDTAVYEMLARQARSPRQMADGRLRGILLDSVTATWLGEQQPPPAWPLAAAEQQALERGDVPCFYARGGSRDVYAREVDDGGEAGELACVAPGVFAVAGEAMLHSCARRMGGADLALQAHLIERSFAASADVVEMASADADAAGEGAVDDEGPLERGGALGEGGAIDSEGLRAAGVDIAEQIVAALLPLDDLSFNVDLVPDPTTGAPRVSAADPTLYGGQAGISLLLAAAATRCADPERAAALREAAERCLAPVRGELHHDPQRLVAHLGVGGFDGIGGVIWALAHVARLLDARALHDDARLAVGAVVSCGLPRDGAVDLHSGLAGLICGLEPLGGGQAAKLVAACARRLVARAVPQPGGGLGWPAPGAERARRGMAHGSAGVALALSRAWRRSDDEALREAAYAALQHECAGDDAPSMQTWCNGEPGRALALATALRAPGAPGELDEALQRAVTATEQVRLRSEHLCCGVGGLDAVLLEVGRLRSDPALAGAAARRTAERLHARLRRGRAPRVRGNGLMLGLAGVGYALLRASDVGRGGARRGSRLRQPLPCVLTLGG